MMVPLHYQVDSASTLDASTIGMLGQRFLVVGQSCACTVGCLEASEPLPTTCQQLLLQVMTITVFSDVIRCVLLGKITLA